MAHSAFRIGRRKPSASRDGYALILVLGMIAMTLAVCYSMLRVQATSVQVANNATRESSARQAALAGMSVAIRKMHQADWDGIDTPLAGQINSTDSFSVTFATGDDQLTNADADYRWWPYRVTVTSIGTSTDPNNAVLNSTHQVTSVLQLVPRAFSDEPADWTTMNNYTVYQWDNNGVPIHVPVQIAGSAMLQGALNLCADYPYDEKPFHGTIDDVVIYDRALSSIEITFMALYSAIFSNDALGGLLLGHSPAHWWRLNESAGATTVGDSAGGNNGTIVGATAGATGPSFAPNNKATWFNGTSDHVDLGKFDLNGSATTISAWLKVDSFGNEDGRIVSKATSDAEADHYFMLSTIKSGSNYRLRFRLKAGGSTSTLIASSGNLYTGQWVYVVATYDGSSMRLYKDGSLVGWMAKSGTINTAPTVPVFLGDNPPGGSRGQYLRDLKSMADAGNDYRPFASTVDLPQSNSSTQALSLMEEALGLTLNNIAGSNSTPLSFPSGTRTYRLYPGGQSYSMVQIPAGTYSGSTSHPSPETNPLGIIYHTGQLTADDNIDFEGTLLSTGSGGDLTIVGTNVNMRPAWLPTLQDSSETYHLPTAIVSDDIRIQGGADVQLQGLTVSWDDFEFVEGSDTTLCTVEGRVLTKELKLQPRDEWQQTQDWYRTQLWLFREQKEAGGVGAVNYFPEWLEQQHSLAAAPKLKIQPPASDIRYHWQDWDEPIFKVHASDEGLRWDLIRWSIAP